MKWFKHSSTASQDAKLKKLRIKYGMEGYGLYWYCVELIASEVDVNKLTFELEHDSEVLAHDTGIHYERVEEMMRHMVNLGLFQGDNHQITCMQLAKRADDYLQKALKRAGKLDCLDSVRTMSEQCTDKVRLEESRSDQSKVDKTKKNNVGSSDDKPDPALESVKRIYAYWHTRMSKDGKTKMTEGRKRAIKARLKNFSEEDIITAIEGCAARPWNMGDNPDGKTFNDLTLICRNDEKIDFYREAAHEVMQRNPDMSRQMQSNWQSIKDLELD